MSKNRTVKSLGLFAAALLGASPSLFADPPSPSGGETTSNPTTAAAADAAAKALAQKKLYMSFFERLDVDIREQLGSPAYTPPDAPAPAAPGATEPKDESPAATPPVLRRGQPAPFDSPPYPTGEWQIGGTPEIGDPGVVAPGPLMQAIYDGPNGDAIKASRIQLYGWEDFSGNLSTSHNTSRGQNANFPEVYDERPNRIEQNQFVGILERVPDEYQTDHIDWGFRIAGVYGLDYRYMISRGFLDYQLLDDDHHYGFDLPMMYLDIYVPWIAEGFNVRIGRIISEADIEAQLAPNNPMSSHSLLYGFDPYTMWGIFTTTKLTKMWTLQLGLSAGNDVAPWQADQGKQATGSVMLQWVHPNNKDSFYGGANAFNNAEFGYNNIQQYVGTYTHKFNETVWTSTEGWYMYQLHGTTMPTMAVPYQNGFFPTKDGYTKEYAFLNYTFFRLTPDCFFTVRNEMFNDCDGNRTGYATVYSEHSIGLTYWPDKMITIRPELRYEHAYNAKPYDNGARANQFTAQFDVIVHY
jgi:hypothetical protein